MATEVRVMLRLTPDMHARLVALAKRESRSLQGQLVYMLRKDLERDVE